MSRPLPPEILDLIIDDLHDQQAALLVCCTVSKSWIPRARRHIFSRLEFWEGEFEYWMKDFPDPSNSPAHYIQSLMIFGTQLISAATADVGRPWIRAFCNIVHLHVDTRNLQPDDDGPLTFAPLHGLSPTLRSLHLRPASPQHSEVFALLCSFPLLEDFTFNTILYPNRADEWKPPLSSPRLTGSLELSVVNDGIGSIIHQLLDLPSGLNFRKIALKWICDEDLKAMTDLVSGCSGSIESLDVTDSPGYSGVASLDLSTAMKLRGLRFHCSRTGVQWVTMALQTVRSNNLQQITIRPYPRIFLRTITEEAARREWGDLDRLLVQLLASHSIRLKVACGQGVGEEFLRSNMQRLLPQSTRRGPIYLVEYPQLSNT